MGDKNKIIWITGGSTGIGRATVELLASNNYKLAVSSRKETSLNIILKETPSIKNNVLLFPTDISIIEKIEETYKSISKNNSVSCLINNAGITSFKPAEENSAKEIEEIINTNLLGAIYTIKTVLPDMIKRKSGTIINILSVAAKKIFTNSSAYAASKAGLLAYTNVLREEVRKYNIRIINVFPGATKTPIWPNEALEKYSDRMMNPNDIALVIQNLISMNGNIVPEEIVLRPTKGDL